MKIAINKCFGGFSISKKAAQKLVEDFGQTKFKYVNEEGRVDYYTHPHNDFFNNISEKEPFHAHRVHSALVSVIEELGEEANGDFAELEVIEIPNDVEWQIQEYAGIETVHEAHSVWH